MADKKEAESNLQASLKTVQSLDVSMECFIWQCVIVMCLLHDKCVIFNAFKEEEARSIKVNHRVFPSALCFGEYLINVPLSVCV